MGIASGVPVFRHTPSVNRPVEQVAIQPARPVRRAIDAGHRAVAGGLPASCRCGGRCFCLVDQSILRRFTARGHLDEARFEPRERLDEIALSRHHLVDVLVGHRHLVEAGREQRDASLA